MMRRGNVCLGSCGVPSLAGVDDGVASLMTTLARLRFNVDLAPLPGVSLGVSFGVSGAGAASSRARVLVDRRGSDIVGSLPCSVSHYVVIEIVDT